MHILQDDLDPIETGLMYLHSLEFSSLTTAETPVEDEEQRCCSENGSSNASEEGDEGESLEADQLDSEAHYPPGVTAEETSLNKACEREINEDQFPERNEEIDEGNITD